MAYFGGSDNFLLTRNYGVYGRREDAENALRMETDNALSQISEELGVDTDTLLRDISLSRTSLETNIDAWEYADRKVTFHVDIRRIEINAACKDLTLVFN